MTIANNNDPDGLNSEDTKSNNGSPLRTFGWSILYSVVVLFIGAIILIGNVRGPHSIEKVDYGPSTNTLASASLVGIMVIIGYLSRKQFYRALAAIVGLAPLFYYTLYYLITDIN